jgi:two-component system chemotaxis response regulator CheB
VLVVDDSRAMRAVVMKALRGEPGIEVVGVAGDGVSCLERIRTLSPDIVSLDVEMPGMDGIETVAAIRKENADLPIMMFSSFTKQGAEVTISALLGGASDYATKPSSSGGTDAAVAAIRRDLVPKLLRLVERGCEGAGSTGMPDRAEPHVDDDHDVGDAGADVPFTGVSSCAWRPEIVVVAASTGGPNVLATFLGGLPADFPVPVAIVQHMPPLFVRILARRLNAGCPLSVRELASPTALRPGEVWLAPGDCHMEVSESDNGALIQARGAGEKDGCVPSADILFSSAARVYGRTTLGIVLTGMGRDGARGALEICRTGGRIYAQDFASSVVWGMPGAVCKSGLASMVLPAESLARETVRTVRGIPVPEEDRAPQPEVRGR